MTTPHLMLFDLYVGGHHLHYLQYLLEYWVAQGLKGRLDVVVPAHFVEQRPWLPSFVETHAGAGLGLVPVTDPVLVETDRRFKLVRDDLEHGRYLREYVARLRPDHCLCMFFDRVQLSLALDLSFDFPVRLSGIYFRPSFHYDTFDTPESAPSEWRHRLQKRLLLAAALRNRHVGTLFSLDEYAVPHIPRPHAGVDPVHLPDGFEAAPGDGRRPALLDEVGPGRRTALLFGALDSRKGVFEVLEALPLLSAAHQASLCVILAGAVRADERARLHALMRTVHETTAAQVLLSDGHVPDDEIQALVRHTDLMLVTYQRHIGSSNVLIRAAAEARPVLGSDYGLVGEHIRRRRLGLAVDTTRPAEIARALTAFLDHPDDLPFDPDEARRFGRENTSARYAETIFRRLGFAP